jgi:hypothetical protein
LESGFSNLYEVIPLSRSGIVRVSEHE